jgi:death on curing protein
MFLVPWEKAAALADAIIRRQPFVDGNKRVAAMAAARVLDLFGFDLVADPGELTHAIIALDRGEIGEDDFAEWLRVRSVSLEAPEPIE